MTPSPAVASFAFPLRVALALLLVADVAAGEVVGIDVRRRDDAGTH